jgi:CheY-like chemotaxis protein
VAQVLVVDDDEAVRALLRLSLEMDGHRVVAEAADGREALEAARLLQPDVVVLDMMMPGTTGADVLRELPDLGGQSRPCVIAYSASPTHLKIADELGADAVVLKSGDLADLLAAVAGC